VIRSGFLSQKLEDVDTVMADKGFQIKDPLPLGVKLKILPFLNGDSEMSAEDVIRDEHSKLQVLRGRYMLRGQSRR